MLRRTIAVTAGSATLLALAAGPALATTDLADLETVDIEVRISETTAPDDETRVLRVEGAPVVDGPELTAADLVAPSEQCGDVEVDVDPAGTVTITSTDPTCVAGQVDLVVSSADQTARPGVVVTSNGLVTWEPDDEQGFELDGSETSTLVLAAAWWATPEQTMTLVGESVFTLEGTEPVPTPEPTASVEPTTEPSAEPTAVAPTPTAPVARPVQGEADFTG